MIDGRYEQPPYKGVGHSPHSARQRSSSRQEAVRAPTLPALDALSIHSLSSEQFDDPSPSSATTYPDPLQLIINRDLHGCVFPRAADPSQRALTFALASKCSSLWSCESGYIRDDGLVRSSARIASSGRTLADPLLPLTSYRDAVQWSVFSLAVCRCLARYCLPCLRAFTYTFFPPVFLPPFSSLAS